MADATKQNDQNRDAEKSGQPVQLDKEQQGGMQKDKDKDKAGQQQQGGQKDAQHQQGGQQHQDR